MTKKYSKVMDSDFYLDYHEIMRATPPVPPAPALNAVINMIKINFMI